MRAGVSFGVIGHVDHGKTALVRALTGIETDRLEEERERGLSIVLGFAFFDTASGVVDLIDAPGHEDFIRAMIGGASGIDGVILCVAANEGIKPQTIEHFNIVRLLAITRGVIAITKTDAVDAARIAAIRRDLAALVHGSFLEGAAVIETSALAGEGIDDLRAALAALAAAPDAPGRPGPAFLPIDRVFTIHGFGVVVTGTLRGAALSVGDSVAIMPAGHVAGVRGLENHHQPVERIEPGQRAAVNLRAVEREDVRRGDVLAAPGSVSRTTRVDVELELLAQMPKPVGNGASLRFMTGTSEAMARLRLLDRHELEPGATALAQVDLDRPIATAVSEHFLVRAISPMQTLGGGRILDVNPARHRRFDATVTRRLETVVSGDLERIVGERLADAGGAGLHLAQLAETLGRAADDVRSAATRLPAKFIDEDLVLSTEAYEGVVEAVIAALAAFHAAEPLRSGIAVGSLGTFLQSVAEPLTVRHALNHLVGAGRAQLDNEVASLRGHDPFASLTDVERRLVERIEKLFRDGGLEPPSADAIGRSGHAGESLLALLIESGRLVRLRTYDRATAIVLHADTVAASRLALIARFPYPAPFAVKDVRDLLGSTRRHIVPLLEHFDAIGVTTRHGDLRRLRAGSQS